MAGICQPETLPEPTLPPPCQGDFLLFTLELPSRAGRAPTASVMGGFPRPWLGIHSLPGRAGAADVKPPGTAPGTRIQTLVLVPGHSPFNAIK